MLEGDEPSQTWAGRPGQKFALGPGSAPKSGGHAESLPEAYGTGRLTLIARDPRWLYAQWDFTWAQQQRYNSLSSERNLILRVHRFGHDRAPIELRVHPDSRHWFVPIEQSTDEFCAELGFYQANGQWVSLTSSARVRTPPEAPSENKEVLFATFHGGTESSPGEDPRSASAAAGKEFAPYPFPEEFLSSPKISTPIPPGWTPARNWSSDQTLALERFIEVHQVRHDFFGSEEILEIIRSRDREMNIPELFPAQPSPGEASSITLAMPAGGANELPTSPGGSPQKAARSFWFNINAELIIYGATDPAARVTIGGRPIRLRPDGSFSYRFALPDGKYDLDVAATAPWDESRQARLKFRRQTEFLGEVHAHPQDAALKKPSPENIA